MTFTNFSLMDKDSLISAGKSAFVLLDRLFGWTVFCSELA